MRDNSEKKKLRNTLNQPSIKLWYQRSLLASDLYSKVLWPDRPVWNKYIDLLQKYHLARMKRKIKPKDKVLDIGCGTGRISLWLASTQAQIKGIDIVPNNIKLARSLASARNLKNVSFEIGDARNLNRFSDSFDWVFSMTCLACLPSDKDFFLGVKSIMKVLKKGGRAVLIENISAGPHLLSISVDKWLNCFKQCGGSIETVRVIDIPILRKVLIETPGVIIQKLITRRNLRKSESFLERDKQVVQYYQKMPCLYKVLENIVSLIGIILLCPLEILFSRFMRKDFNYIFLVIKKI